ncbi:hypothetical protein [Streptomyces sp. NPDC001594]|uniref:hypothetical protein n=1 Tax=Streptomyces sp. NPDC001594 TaxID=3364590 RepID=UPI003678A090
MSNGRSVLGRVVDTVGQEVLAVPVGVEQPQPPSRLIISERLTGSDLRATAWVGPTGQEVHVGGGVEGADPAPLLLEWRTVQMLREDGQLRQAHSDEGLEAVGGRAGAAQP